MAVEQGPDLFAWVGAVGGVIGAIGGIAGTWMGVLSIKRTGEQKSLDLRVQLQREESTIKSDVAEIVPLIQRAFRSRLAVLSANGMLHSSVRQQFEAGTAVDTGDAQELWRLVEPLGGDVSKLSHADLEKRLVEAHQFKRRSDDLTSKYREALEQDDRMRAQIAERNNRPRA